jgi:ankyrin repeat protein
LAEHRKQQDKLMSNFPNYYPYASGQMPLNAQAYQQDQLQNLTNLCLGGTFYHKQPALDLINSMSADQLNTTTSWGLGVNAGYLPITAAIQGGDFDLVIALINRGAKIDTPDARGNTALSLGVNSHNAEINTYFGQIQADREQAARAAAQSQSTGVHSYALDPYPHLSSIYDPTNLPSSYHPPYHPQQQPSYYNSPPQQSYQPQQTAYGSSYSNVSHPVSIAAAPIQMTANRKLFEACKKADFHAVRDALDKGADPNAVNDDGDTALFCIGNGSDAKNIAIELVSKGANVNAKDIDGRTPLFLAVYLNFGQHLLVKELLDLGADPLLQDPKGKIALDIAAKNVIKSDKSDAWNTVRVLLEGRGKRSQYALQQLQMVGMTVADIGGRLGVDEVDANEVLKAFRCHAPQCFAPTGHDSRSPTSTIDAATQAGRNPSAQAQLDAELLKACGRNAGIAVLNELLNAGASPNAVGAAAMTPLKYAILKKSTDNIELLLKYGADPNLASTQGRTTPLHFAAAKAPEMMNFLISKGADPNLRNAEAKTAYEIAGRL